MANYDFLVVGGGVGGIYAALEARKYGASVRLITRDSLGGTCVNRGCARKKLFWDAVDLHESVLHSKSYGFPLQSAAKFEWARFKDGSDAFVTKVNAAYEDMLKAEGVDVIFGDAHIRTNNMVDVMASNGKKYMLQTKTILLALGSQPIVPTIPGAGLGITSDGFFNLSNQPEKAVIVGEGYVAVELASLLQALGTTVHLFNRQNVFLRKFDTIIQQSLDKNLERQGIAVHRKCNIMNLKRVSKDIIQTSFDCNGVASQLDSSCVIWAIGRQPQTECLGLESLGILRDDLGHIIVNEEWQTNLPTVFSVGDACSRGEALTPVAVAAGSRLARKLFGHVRQATAAITTMIPSVVFAHPPIGAVGDTEQQARLKYGIENVHTIVYETFTTFYWAMMPQEDHVPLVYKIVYRVSDRIILGLHLCGRRVDEILQGFAVAIAHGITIDHLDGCMNIHPTTSEELLVLGKVGTKRDRGQDPNGFDASE